MSDTDEDSNGTENSWPVNEDWLMDVLKKHHNNDSVTTIPTTTSTTSTTPGTIKIVDFSVKSACQHGISNLSDLLAVSVIYEYDEQQSVKAKTLDIIIKLLPHDPFSRYFVTEAQFDLREIKFYTKILPDLLKFQIENLKINCQPMKVSVPKCFHTQYSPGLLPVSNDESPEPPESILVLEDMRTYGYKAAHFSNGLNLLEAESAIKAISVIHALSLGMKFKEKINLNEKYPFLFQITKATDSYQQLVEQGLPQLGRFLEKTNGRERELNALTNIRSKTRSIIANLLQPIEPMGLITHTDFWCNNLLIKETINEGKDDNCIILDWQMITYSRPTNDIALLLISSLSSNIRRENTRKLLDLYYSELRNNLDKISVDLEIDLDYSRDKLDEDYRKSQLLAVLLCIGSVDIALGNRDAEQRFLDVLSDLHEDGILNYEEISI